MMHQGPWSGVAELDIYQNVVDGLRPFVDDHHEDDALVPLGWISLMRKCWSQDPQQRPPFESIYAQLEAMHRSIFSLDFLESNPRDPVARHTTTSVSFAAQSESILEASCCSLATSPSADDVSSFLRGSPPSNSTFLRGSPPSHQHHWRALQGDIYQTVGKLGVVDAILD